MNKIKKYFVLLVFLASATAKVFPWGYGITTNTGMNNPYYDDKLFHYGFFLGMNFMGYGVTESLQPIGGEIYHARVSTITPGFRVGLIVDMRLAKYLNLRFTPGLDFATRAIRFKNESGNPFPANNPHDVHMLSLPIDAPILLKYSAQRVGNYRPYVIGGGGVQYDFSGDKERAVLQKPFDGYVTVGFGCDFYFPWFKFCPEIRYQLGFANVITPSSKRPELPAQNAFYTDAISRLRNHMITLTFNFE